MLKQSPYFTQQDEDYVECSLCPHRCFIPPGERGRCGVRINKNGSLFSETYGMVSRVKEYEVAQLPFRPVFSSSRALMVGSKGCNMKCPFCLTWDVAQTATSVKPLSPEQLIEKSKSQDIKVLVFNVNEPTLWIEYISDVFALAQKEEISLAAVSNGMINIEPLNTLLKCLSALCIDIKTWDSETYAKEWGGDLEAIKEAVVRAHKTLANFSVSYLLISRENDRKIQLEDCFQWLAKLSYLIPLFLIPYQPAFYYKKRETSEVRLYQVSTLAQKYLQNVNVLPPYC